MLILSHIVILHYKQATFAIFAISLVKHAATGTILPVLPVSIHIINGSKVEVSAAITARKELILLLMQEPKSPIVDNTN